MRQLHSSSNMPGSRTHRRPWICAGLLAACAFLVAACSETSRYERLAERERQSGEIHNDLFLGYSFGMPKDTFYEHSWALNRQGLVMQGPKNQTVQYELDDDLPHPAHMFFYPDFHEEAIFQMRVRFLYDGWAPWNPELSSDTLQHHVKDLLEAWHGGEFVAAESDTMFGGGVSFYKVDGNRRILIGRHSDSEAFALYTDLRAETDLANVREAGSTAR